MFYLLAAEADYNRLAPASDSIDYQSVSLTLKREKRDGSASYNFLSWHHAISGVDSSGAYDAATTLAADRRS